MFSKKSGIDRFLPLVVLLVFLNSCKEDVETSRFCETYNVICTRQPSPLLDRTEHLLNIYTPHGLEIFDVHLAGCTREDIVADTEKYLTPFDKSLEEASFLDSLDGLKTVVHEYSHGISSGFEQAGEVNQCDIRSILRVYIQSSESYDVPVNESIPAKEILEEIPSGIKDRMIYVSYLEAEGHVAQMTGAYGLLDEYQAYYHGLKTGLELAPHFIQAFDSLPDRDDQLLSFILTFESEFSAYYEFKYFILLYNHLKGENTSLQDNTVFWEAFEAVGSEYESLIEAYESMLDAQPELKNFSSWNDLKQYFDQIEHEIEELK